MSGIYRGDLIRRPGGRVSLVGSSEPAVRRSQEAALRRCRWCGRSTAEDTRQVIEHVDLTPGGATWSEHAGCRPVPDLLETDTDWRI